MNSAHIIERAFQLADQCTSIDELGGKLKREGYAQVDAHLNSRQLRSQLAKMFVKATAEEKLPPAVDDEA
jgi:hypothetical protein